MGGEGLCSHQVLGWVRAGAPSSVASGDPSRGKRDPGQGEELSGAGRWWGGGSCNESPSGNVNILSKVNFLSKQKNGELKRERNG